MGYIGERVISRQCGGSRHHGEDAVQLAAGNDRGGAGIARVPARAFLLRHLLSFELVFALFVYSNNLKIFVSDLLPVDETLLFLAVSLGVGIWIVLREGLYMRALPILVGLAAFAAYLIVSYGWSDLRRFPTWNLIDFMVFVVLPAALGGIVLASDRDRTARFLLFVAVIGLLVAVRGLWIYFEYGTFMYWRGWQEFGIRRIHIKFGYAAAAAAAVWLALVMFSRLGSARQLLGVAAFVVCAGFVLVAGARGPLLGIALAILLVLFLQLPKLPRGRLLVAVPQLLALLLVAALGAVLLLGFEELSREFYTFGRLVREVQTFFADDGLDPVVRGASRVKYWPAAVEAWRQHPLFGLGFKGFGPWFKGVVDPGVHPHNIVLQVLSELGLAGLALFLLLVVLALRDLSIARLREDRLLAATLLYGVAAGIEAMFAAPLERQTTFFLALALLALRPPAAASAERPRLAVSPSPASRQLSVHRRVRS